MDGLSNAILTAINAPGTPDGYGDVATAGAAAWTGRAPAYLKRIRRRVMSNGEMTLMNADVLWLLGSAGAPVVEAAGDQLQGSTVLVEDRRTAPAVTRRFRVVAVENRAAGTPVDNIRLELDDDRAA